VFGGCCSFDCKVLFVFGDRLGFVCGALCVGCIGFVFRSVVFWGI